jgi:hypothetical protein
MAVALVPWVSQMATNTMGSSIPAAPWRALLLVLVFCPNDAATARCSGPSPAHGVDVRDVGYDRISWFGRTVMLKKILELLALKWLWDRRKRRR